MLRAIVVFLCLICMTACTSMRVIDEPSRQNLAQKVEVGDLVSLTTRDGKHYDLTITQVDETTLVGRDGSDKPWRVNRKAIEQLEVKRISALKTGGLTVGVIVVAIAAILAVGFHALDHQLDHHDD
ncbi:MAG TPA: hypothetical protein VFM56_06405 [Solimonas sp.]|nr:hypothetical protein [Solimonas sp.]